MNYRHAFHAGNFADCLKHAVLALLLRALLQKDKPLAFLDLHAGIGTYDLGELRALKTGEASLGIARLWPPPKGALGDLLSPYLAVVAGLNQGGALKLYPGSPAIAQALLRPQDRLILNELHPDDVASLKKWAVGDERISVHRRDAVEALPALVPPKERRGLVLIDPPFEQPQEGEKLVAALTRAYNRWPTGSYLFWYPIKAPAQSEALLTALKAAIPRRLLVGELTLYDRAPPDRLNGSGLALINPPWQFEETLSRLLSHLQPLLSRDGGRSRVEWLVGDTGVVKP